MMIKLTTFLCFSWVNWVKSLVPKFQRNFTDYNKPFFTFFCLGLFIWNRLIWKLKLVITDVFCIFVLPIKINYVKKKYILLKYILSISERLVWLPYVKSNVCYKLFKLDLILVVIYSKCVSICHFFQSTNYICNFKA